MPTAAPGSTRSWPPCRPSSGSRPGSSSCGCTASRSRSLPGSPRRGRGLIPMLAARRAREGGAGSAVLLVLLATATVGAFAMTALDHLERGAEVAAWQQVGAGYRLQQPTGALPAGFDAATLPAVEADSRRLRGDRPGVDHRPPGAGRDRPRRRRSRRSSPGRPPSRLPGRVRDGGAGPIPAIISTSLAESPAAWAGRDVHPQHRGLHAHLQGRGGPRLVPGRAVKGHFILVSREAFLGQAPPARVVPVYSLVRAPETPPPRSARPSRRPSRRSSVTSQAETAAALRAQPVTNAVRDDDPRRRARDGRLCGARRRGGTRARRPRADPGGRPPAHARADRPPDGRATLAEHGPITVAAFIAGGLLGAALFALLRRHRASARSSGRRSRSRRPRARPLLLIFVAMIVVVGFGLWLGAMLQRRVAPTAALRGRFE